MSGMTQPQLQISHNHGCYKSAWAVYALVPTRSSSSFPGGKEAHFKCSNKSPLLSIMGAGRRCVLAEITAYCHMKGHMSST
jgi:hypothetical protein